MAKRTLTINTGWLALLAGALLLLAMMTLGSVLGGCATPQSDIDGPPVQVLAVSGSGSIAMKIHGHMTSVAFSERYEDGVRCTIVESVTIDGIMLGAGFLPPPVSDDECAEKYPPFRSGGSAIPPLGATVVDRPAGSDSPASTRDPATPPLTLTP